MLRVVSLSFIVLPELICLKSFYFKKENDNVCEVKGASSKRNCIGTSNAKNRGPLLRLFDNGNERAWL